LNEKMLLKVARPGGLEPTTFGSGGQRSIYLPEGTSDATFGWVNLFLTIHQR
jgi:hypothetical protein